MGFETDQFHHSSSGESAAQVKLQQESAQLLRSTARTQHESRRTHQPKAETEGDKSKGFPGLEGNEYTVKPGDTLSSIARRMLKLRGEATTARNIYEEVERIIDQNTQKHPWIEKNPSKIRPGMRLAVWDDDTGPDPSCKWGEWKDADREGITVARKCESIFASKDTKVIVAPGARAVFTSGSYGFVAPHGFARVNSGSQVTAVGGKIFNDGGDLQVLHPDTKVIGAKKREPEAVAERTAPSKPEVPQPADLNPYEQDLYV